MHPTIYGNTYTEVMDLEVYDCSTLLIRLAMTFPSISKVNSWPNRVSLS